MKVQTWLIDIPLDQCEDLLELACLGRLGVIVDGRPEIFPVNHVFDRETGCVIFPTNAGTKLHGALNWPWVAFEVDGMDLDDGGGWSVVVLGRAARVKDPDKIVGASNQRHVPWRSDPSVQWVQIVPSKITGRRIGAVVG